MNIYSLLLEVITMPNQDGTGPNGEGPKTGNQRGNCEGTRPRPRGRMCRRRRGN